MSYRWKEPKYVAGPDGRGYTLPKPIYCRVCFARAKSKAPIDGAHVPVCDKCWDAAFLTAEASGAEAAGAKTYPVETGSGFKTLEVLRSMIKLADEKRKET